MNEIDLEKFLKEKVFAKVHNDFLRILEEKRDSEPEIYNELKYLKYSIFYSNPLHTLKEGKIYFMGLNPGGCYNEDEDRKCLYGYDNNLNIYKNLKENYCSFLDEYWEDEINEKYSILQVKLKKVLDYVLSILEYPITVREIFFY